MLARAKTEARREELEARLLGPAVPPAGLYLWGWFNELSDARGAGGLGPAPISYPDILAWSRLTGRRPAPWEIGVIKALDLVYLTCTQAPADD
ncbi:MAG: hypothetical protein J0H82_06270 [Alphaproteobacteria bacterium]|nr:hypothetical protein [Alphaproteobacteria bacterium]